MTRYRNPWHKPRQPQYGPAWYETDAMPVEHAGHLIYERIKGRVWDIVKGGACRSQCAGLDGAKRAAERFGKFYTKNAVAKCGVGK